MFTIFLLIWNVHVVQSIVLGSVVKIVETISFVANFSLFCQVVNGQLFVYVPGVNFSYTF